MWTPSLDYIERGSQLHHRASGIEGTTRSRRAHLLRAAAATTRRVAHRLSTRLVPASLIAAGSAWARTPTRPPKRTRGSTRTNTAPRSLRRSTRAFNRQNSTFRATSTAFSRSRRRSTMARRRTRRRRGGRPRKVRFSRRANRRRGNPGNRLIRTKPFKMGTGFPLRMFQKHRYVQQLTATAGTGSSYKMEWGDTDPTVSLAPGVCMATYRLNCLGNPHWFPLPTISQNCRWYTKTKAVGYTRYRVTAVKISVRTRIDIAPGDTVHCDDIKTVAIPYDDAQNHTETHPTTWDDILERRLNNVTCRQGKSSSMNIFYKMRDIERMNKILFNADADFYSVDGITNPVKKPYVNIYLLTRDGTAPPAGFNDNVHLDIQMTLYTTWDRIEPDAGTEPVT